MRRSTLPYFTLTVSFGAIVVLLAALLGLILLRIESINENLHTIAGENMRKIELATRLRESISQRQITLRDLFLQKDFFDRDDKRMEFYKEAQPFVDTRDELLKLPADKNEQLLLENIRSFTQAAYPLQNELVELGMIPNAPDTVVAEKIRRVFSAQSQVKDEINKLFQYQRLMSQMAAQKALQTYKDIRYLITVLGGGTIVLTLLIAASTIVRTKSQTRKIEELSRFPNENPSPVVRVKMDGTILFANSASQCMLKEWECQVGDKMPAKWLRVINKLDKHHGCSEYEIKCGDRIFALTLTSIAGANYVNFYGKDITERENMKRRIAYQASHDSLTGLINRHEFEKRLQQLIDDAITENREHALLYCDLDKFKIVNDSCGHAAGDKLLKQLTALMKNKIRNSDTLARLGGDEFGVLLQSCSPEKAMDIAESLRETVKDFRFLWDNRTFEVGLSIGVVPISKLSGKMTDILATTDSACYVAKEQGRNRICAYKEGDKAIAEKRGEMLAINKINDAIENQRFYLDFQIISPLNELQPSGTHGEILLRMKDHEGNIVSPAAFIPAAERYDLMPSIDRWVVNTCINKLHDYYAAQARHPVYCSINLSGQSIGREGFLDFLLSTIENSNVAPEYLCFEITETAAIANIDSAIHLIDRLKAIGCRFALDDFGSGLSSFNYLKSLNIDYLKIDGSFVKDILNAPIDRAIVEAINKVGHEMGIKTVAEYVENTKIANKLEVLGVDYGQGFGLHMPQSFDLLLSQLAHSSATASNQRSG